MKTGVTDDRVREVRRVARLIAKKYPKLQKAFLIDYMESTHDRLESVDLGVVVSHGSYEPADYDFLRIYFAGEVGCGKSTILLAMDFALFGLRKGELEGTDLLRHGKNNGSVEIAFEVEGNKIVLMRTLKRSKASVTQDSGIISINGREQELMPVELKSKILELFGYPQEVLKKNRPLFRYTVYTPQEKMKDILFDSESRLETLRKIFSVDKYGQIKNNAKLFMSELRSMKRENEAFTRDLEQKMSEKEERETEKERLMILLDKYII